MPMRLAPAPPVHSHWIACGDGRVTGLRPSIRPCDIRPEFMSEICPSHRIYRWDESGSSSSRFSSVERWDGSTRNALSVLSKLSSRIRFITH